VIEAREFLEPALARGFTWYAGVPCSYLTPFINYVLQDSSLRYLSMTNEGDAVAAIAGISINSRKSRPHRGVAMMQNSGLGNAVSPLTSLTWTFRLPQLLIVTWRGQPGVPDEPQHELMGRVTPELLDAMAIAWEPFPAISGDVGPALGRALEHMDKTGRSFAFLMGRQSVAPFPLKPGVATSRGPSAPAQGVQSRLGGLARPSRKEVLAAVIANSPVADTVLFASTGYCGRELYAIEDRPNHLYMVGSMGCVGSFAMGFALAHPQLQVIALDGDGAVLMRLGSMATMGAYGPPNLRHLLLDNGVHESTGGQATVSAQIDFAQIAMACGYASALETDDLTTITQWLQSAPLSGPRFARALIRPGTASDLPRPAATPVNVKTRLMHHLHSARGAD
jgi:phosphonopyruvate decarboxylase